MNIRIFDWRDPDTRGAGIAVAFGDREADCSCYNVSDPSNPFDWDVGIAAAAYGLDDNERHKLRVELAHGVPYLLGLKPLLLSKG